MAMKPVILITLWVVLVATQAAAQLPRIPLFNITGNVSCSLNGSVAVNGTTPTPPFPNALVQLSCRGIVRALAITNRMGVFNFIVGPIQVISLDNLLSSCNVTVVTPLSACNATLPSTGSLQAALRFKENIVVGLFNITHLLVTAFTSVQL